MYEYAVEKLVANSRRLSTRTGTSPRVVKPIGITAVVTANSDTPNSFVLLDLRAEPMVISIPGRQGPLLLVDLTDSPP